MKGAQIRTRTTLKAIVALSALVFVAGCSFFQNRDSGSSWSQTAVKEEQQQQLNSSPQGDFDMQP
jgi:hypothetical protein